MTDKKELDKAIRRAVAEDAQKRGKKVPMSAAIAYALRVQARAMKALADRDANG